MRPLRVLYLGHTAKLSGGEIALARLLPHLTEVVPIVVLAEDGPLVKWLSDLGIEVHVMPMSGTAREVRKDAVGASFAMLGPAIGTVRYVNTVRRLLRRERPDIVHTNSLKAGVYGSVAARLAGVPVVWHVRDRIAADYLPRVAVTLIQGMLRVLPNAIIVNSVETQQTVPASRREASRVVPEVILPRPHTTRSRVGPFRIGIVGRLAPWKGQDVFLRAFAQAFSDGDEEAVVVGAAMFGEDDFASSLTSLAESLGVARRVDFRGFREDVLDELGGLDVLVHASLSAEPFGQVILEGLAAGVPVVASAGGGPSEILTHEANGILYRGGDVEGLAAELIRLRTDAGLRDRLSAAGRERALDFGPEGARTSVMAVYDQLVAVRLP